MFPDTLGALYGFLPFLVIGSALIITYALFVLNATMASEIMSEILVAMGAIWLIVVSVLVFMRFFCMDIHPTEHFTDFEKELTKTEATVCTLKEEVRKFVASEIGQSGQDDPSLIAKAMDVGAPLSDCKQELPLNERFARMERTLVFAEQVLKRTYAKVMTCEGLEDYVNNQERLKAIQAKVYSLTKMYLDPLLQNQSDLQKGIISDCNKRRAAAAI
jgi:hypothetical protein